MAETASTEVPGGTAATDDPSVKDRAQEKAGEVKEQVQEKAGEVKDHAQQAAGRAGSIVRDQVDQRSTQAGQQVTRQASDLRSVGEELRGKGMDGPARIAEQVAERTERVGTWLTESDADRILGDIEDIGRRNPWAVVAGGVAVGLVASRLLKASSSRRYEGRQRRDLLPARTGETGRGADVGEAVVPAGGPLSGPAVVPAGRPVSGPAVVPGADRPPSGTVPPEPGSESATAAEHRFERPPAPAPAPPERLP